MFESALKSLTHRGRLLEISSASERRVSFDLVDFYHNESRLIGVDTRARNSTQSAVLLEALMPFFERGAFQPPRIDRAIALSDGRAAYEEVAAGRARGRLVLVP
jgi:NADPH:quinone reductase-like Zn-dependent oxidoreductase